MATAEEVINSRREMKERTNAAIMRLSLLDCHSESHVSMNKIRPGYIQWYRIRVIFGSVDGLAVCLGIANNNVRQYL